MSPSVSNRIFKIQELVGIICKYMDASDRARLAQSCRRLFYMLMPSLWERVEGLARLFALSPYLDRMSREKHHNLYTEPGIEQFVASQKPLDDEDLVRFDVYSPWIKRLEVCKHGSAPECDAALALLYICSKRRAILPSIELISLTVRLNFRADPIWVIPFLSSSLLGLEFSITDSSYHWSIPLVESTILLSLVSTECPQLRTLGFTPRDSSYSLPHRPRISLLHTLTHIADQILEQKLSHYLGYYITTMQPLVRFASSVDIMDVSCFELISTWPCLESFELMFEQVFEQDGYSLELPSFPETAFPVLTHFGLHQIPDWSILEEVWDCSALVGNLTSVKLNMAESCVNFENDTVDDPIFAFSVIATRSPNSQKLWFHVENPDGDDPAYEISTSDLNALGSLPLRGLHLGGIEFEDPKAVPRYMAATFSRIQELGLPDHLITLNELQAFRSELPLLEVLRIKIELETIAPDFEVDLSDVPRHRNIPLHTLGANFIGNTEEESRSDILSMKCSSAKAFSNYLFTLWPNVQIIPQGDVQYVTGTYRHQNAMDLINDQLARLSYCNREPSIKYRNINVLNEDSWEKCKLWVEDMC
ncbi:hypothetical protein FRC12_021112 [Ceratobasidium sp. 428]|nr:hypothetical protein FRC12_021112 [Ceratobasidium sp. 428]